MVYRNVNLTPFIFCKNFRRDEMSGFTTAGIMFFSAIVGGLLVGLGEE